MGLSQSPWLIMTLSNQACSSKRKVSIKQFSIFQRTLCFQFLKFYHSCLSYRSELSSVLGSARSKAVNQIQHNFHLHKRCTIFILVLFCHPEANVHLDNSAAFTKLPRVVRSWVQISENARKTFLPRNSIKILQLSNFWPEQFNLIMHEIL